MKGKNEESQREKNGRKEEEKENRSPKMQKTKTTEKSIGKKVKKK